MILNVLKFMFCVCLYHKIVISSLLMKKKLKDHILLNRDNFSETLSNIPEVAHQSYNNRNHVSICQSSKKAVKRKHENYKSPANDPTEDSECRKNIKPTIINKDEKNGNFLPYDCTHLSTDVQEIMQNPESCSKCKTGKDESKNYQFLEHKRSIMNKGIKFTPLPSFIEGVCLIDDIKMCENSTLIRDFDDYMFQNLDTKNALSEIFVKDDIIVARDDKNELYTDKDSVDEFISQIKNMVATQSSFYVAIQENLDIFADILHQVKTNLDKNTLTIGDFKRIFHKALKKNKFYNNYNVDTDVHAILNIIARKEKSSFFPELKYFKIMYEHYLRTSKNVNNFFDIIKKFKNDTLSCLKLLCLLYIIEYYSNLEIIHSQNGLFSIRNNKRVICQFEDIKRPCETQLNARYFVHALLEIIAHKTTSECYMNLLREKEKICKVLIPSAKTKSNLYTKEICYLNSFFFEVIFLIREYDFATNYNNLGDICMPKTIIGCRKYIVKDAIQFYTVPARRKIIFYATYFYFKNIRASNDFSDLQNYLDIYNTKFEAFTNETRIDKRNIIMLIDEAEKKYNGKKDAKFLARAAIYLILRIEHVKNSIVPFANPIKDKQFSLGIILNTFNKLSF